MLHVIIFKKENAVKLKWGDFVVFFIIASVISVMFVLSIPKDDGSPLYAQIIKDGEILYEISLSDIEGQEEFSLDGRDVIIIAEKDRIRFVESDCRDQICVFTGWISHSNQIAACLPNRILVKIIGKDDEVDAVVG